MSYIVFMKIDQWLHRLLSLMFIYPWPSSLGWSVGELLHLVGIYLQSYVPLRTPRIT